MRAKAGPSNSTSDSILDLQLAHTPRRRSNASLPSRRTDLLSAKLAVARSTTSTSRPRARAKSAPRPSRSTSSPATAKSRSEPAPTPPRAADPKSTASSTRELLSKIARAMASGSFILRVYSLPRARPPADREETVWYHVGPLKAHPWESGRSRTGAKDFEARPVDLRTVLLDLRTESTHFRTIPAHSQRHLGRHRSLSVIFSDQKVPKRDGRARPREESGRQSDRNVLLSDQIRRESDCTVLTQDSRQRSRRQRRVLDRRETAQRPQTARNRTKSEDFRTNLIAQTAFAVQLRTVPSSLRTGAERFRTGAFSPSRGRFTRARRPVVLRLFPAPAAR